MGSYNNSPGVTLSREQVAQIAYQAGARGGDLEFLTGVPQRESSYRPGMHRTSTNNNGAASGDFGLWQINWGAWGDQLRSAGIVQSHTDLYDPAVNAKAAVYALKAQGRGAWAMSTSGKSQFQAGGDPYRGWDQGAAQRAVRNAASRGMLGQDWNQASSAPASSGGGGSTNPDESVGPMDLPADATLVRNDTATVALFDLGNGIHIHYALPTDGSVNLGGRTPQRVSNQEYLRRYGRTVSGGHVEELRLMKGDFGTYRKWWNTILDTVIGSNNPARQDPEVLRVLAEYAGRPDMERAELENKLQATKWWQSRTESELEWNSLSEAEQRTRRQETATRMAQQWMAFTGTAVPVTDNRIQKNLEAVASGKMGIGHWTETVVKPVALTNGESPWSRQRRDEIEAQRQRPIDIENTTARIRDELERYGLRWDAATLKNWSKALVEKTRSDDDLTQTLERAAEAMFPGLGKLSGSDVRTLAAPWLETYERVMEKKGSLYTPEVRRALAAGGQPRELEVELTKSREWLGTRNADERMHSLAGQVTEDFGF